jgi:xanthine dehydrogenase iron-sulfur cluster and FAD-binding subunit A
VYTRVLDFVYTQMMFWCIHESFSCIHPTHMCIHISRYVYTQKEGCRNGGAGGCAGCIGCSVWQGSCDMRWPSNSAPVSFLPAMPFAQYATIGAPGNSTL